MKTYFALALLSCAALSSALQAAPRRSYAAAVAIVPNLPIISSEQRKLMHSIRGEAVTVAPETLASLDAECTKKALAVHKFLGSIQKVTPHDYSKEIKILNDKSAPHISRKEELAALDEESQLLAALLSTQKKALADAEYALKTQSTLQLKRRNSLDTHRTRLALAEAAVKVQSEMTQERSAAFEMLSSQVSQAEEQKSQLLSSVTQISEALAQSKGERTQRTPKSTWSSTLSLGLIPSYK